MGAMHLFAAVLVGLFADAAPSARSAPTAPAASPPASSAPAAPRAAAKPEPLDRIVAVVGEHPIFLSEVRRRARPHFYRVDVAVGDASERSAQKAVAMRQMVERLIDERLMQREADRSRVTVTAAEIDNGIKHVAAQSKMTQAEVLAEAKRQGFSDGDYRAAIRAQVLEGKLIQLRVRGRIRVTEADARSTYDAWVKEQTGPNAPVDLRILVLPVARDASPAARSAAEALAAQIVSQARSGADFCALVAKHSQDSATSGTCGSRGPLAPSALLPAIATATATLKAGETAPPVLHTDGAGASAYLVIQRAPGAQPAVPPFESVREQMLERAFTEATSREAKEWMRELRKTTFVEVKP